MKGTQNAVIPADAEELAQRLAAERRAQAVLREDALERRRAEAAHDRNMADVGEAKRRDDRDRDRER